MSIGVLYDRDHNQISGSRQFSKAHIQPANIVDGLHLSKLQTKSSNKLTCQFQTIWFSGMKLQKDRPLKILVIRLTPQG